MTGNFAYLHDTAGMEAELDIAIEFGTARS